MESLSEPLQRIADWLEEAKEVPELKEPMAMALATADAQGMPSVRIVLLKALDERGLTFFTNSESQKGRELKENPQACLNFYWMPLGRQIRVSGKVTPVSEEESDTYFANRRRGSQIASAASQQSRSLASYEDYKKEVTELEQKYAGMQVPRPPHWHGWRVLPDHIEFWQEGEFRMHHRELYMRSGEGWRKQLIYP